MHQVSLSWIFLYMCQNPFLYIDVTVSDNLSFILKYLKHEIEKRKVEDIFELTYYVGTENIKKLQWRQTFLSLLGWGGGGEND